MMAKFFSLLLLWSLLATISNARNCQIPPKSICAAIKAQIILGTFINGADLIANGYPSPVGDKYMKGPQLNYLKDRTKLSTGKFCADADTNWLLSTGRVPPNTDQTFSVGDVISRDLSGYPEDECFETAKGDVYFQVMDEASRSTKCVLKVNVRNSDDFPYLYDLSMTMEDATVCQQAVPNLKLYNTGRWCNFPMSGMNCKDSKGSEANTYGDTFMVYFDTASNSTSEAAAAGGSDASAPETSPYLPDPSSSSSNNSAPAPASSGSKAFSLFSACVVLVFSGAAAFNFV